MTYPFRILIAALMGLLVISACQVPAEQRDAADLLVINATIYTLDSTFSTAEAMAVRQGNIVAVGTQEEVESQYYSSQVFNAQGKFVYPAFNDAHCHYVGYAEGLLKVNLVGTGSWAEVLQRTQAFADENKVAFIEGRGWDQNDWELKEFPTKKELDSLFPNTPVVLKRIDGHAAIVNQAAFDFAKMVEVPKVEGGLVVTNAQGLPTGLLIDRAVDLIPVPELSRDQKVDALLKAQQNLHAAGIASLTEAGLFKKEILLLDSLQKAGDLALRINAMVSDDSASLNYFLEKGAIATPWLRVKSGKFYLDGALGSRGALLLEPYADDPENYGLQLMGQDYFEKWAQRLAEENWQMCVHTIGDSANRLAIEVFRQTSARKKDSRWRLEHAQIVSPEDLKNMAEGGILPSIQPTHATSDMYWAQERLGATRLKNAYRAQSFLDAGLKLPLGTDFPVEDINPMFTFRAAVYRQDAQAFPDSGFYPRERLSPEEALRGMTVYGAYASFEEKQKGQLKPGFYADFVVFDQELLNATVADLNTLSPRATYVNGEKVFEAVN